MSLTEEKQKIVDDIHKFLTRDLRHHMGQSQIEDPNISAIYSELKELCNA